MATPFTSASPSPLAHDDLTGATPAAAQAAGVAHDAIASADRKADAVLDRLVQGAHETIDRFAEKAAPIADKLGQTADNASQVLRARADDLGEMRQEWTESMRTAVRENPLTAVLAAAAIGVIVAKLTSR